MSFRGRIGGRRGARAGALTVLCVLGTITGGFAQTVDDDSIARIRQALERPAELQANALVVDETTPRRAAEDTGVPDANAQPVLPPKSTAPHQLRGAPPARGRSSRARQVGGAVLGAIGGFWLGAELGAALEGDSCNCDDPGFKGFLIGAPVGAAVGAVLGALLAGT